MNNKISLKNTSISFTPSFSGSGWETSLMPRLEKNRTFEPEFRISFMWLKELLWKMHLGKGLETRQEETIATVG